MKIIGKYNEANVYASVIEEEAIKQIKGLLDCEAYKNSKIAVMPDAHAGAGCVCGLTMTIEDKVCPNLVGVDIGCGMLVVELGKIDVDLNKLDEVCHNVIKSGQNIWDSYDYKANGLSADASLALKESLNKIRSKVDVQRALRSISTLGGGNHFLELDVDDEGNKYFIIHCGSRHLGLEVAKYYQSLAEKNLNNGWKRKLIVKLKAEGREKDIQSELDKHSSPSIPKDLAYVEGKSMENYLHDMEIAQDFARANRAAIAYRIMKAMGWLSEGEIVSCWTTMHNYIDLENKVLRKSAIAAYEGEKVLIPFNMKDGSAICIGKGNKDWNCSAPHGAGRRMSRSAARKTISMEDFKKDMEGIYTTCVLPETIDEAPKSYKPTKVVVEDMEPTVEVVKMIKTLFNFKASS